MIEITHELKDMIISALRYSICRRTYIVNETCEFIKSHKELIDERVKKVMLNDLKNTLNFYLIDDIEFKEFIKLADWLNELNVWKNCGLYNKEMNKWVHLELMMDI